MSKALINQQGHTAIDKSSFIEFYPNFFEASLATEVFTRMVEETPWRTTLYQGMTLPRRQCWMSDPGVVADIFQEGPALNWTAQMLDFRLKIEEQCTPHRKRFDYMLMNLYRDGKDMIGWHADEDAVLERTNMVAVVSLGTTRRFLVKRVPQNYREPKPASWERDIDTNADYEFTLTHGSLLLMGGDMQKNFHHAVPRDFSITEPRISLTFHRS